MSSTKTVTQDTSQHQTAAPPSWTMPGISAASADVLAALNSIPAEHYSGQQVAYMAPEDQAAIQAAWGNTAGQAAQYSDWMGQQLPVLASPYDFTTSLPTAQFDVGSLYDVNPVIQAALNPVYQQLTQQILPGIKSSALDAGAYSGDRAMAVLPQMALNDYTRNAGDIAANIGYENYRDYEARRLAAFEADQNRLLEGYNAETERGLGSQTANNQTMAAIGDYINNMLHTSASVGDLLQMSSNLGVTNQQAQINDALARDKYASYSPFMGLDEASQLLAALSGNWGTTDGTSHTTQTTKSDMTGELVKGALGLAGTVAGIPGIGGVLGLGGGGAAVAPTASSIFINPNPFGGVIPSWTT